jgi:hypothetical protein
LYNDSQEESSMSVNVMVQQDVVRQAVIEVARLPEQDLLRVLAYIDDLKVQRTRSTALPLVAEIRAEADRLAAGMEHQPRQEVMAQFHGTLERIRAQAVAAGTAIDGDWQGD